MQKESKFQPNAGNITNPLKTTPKPKIRRNKSNMIKNGSCDRKWIHLFMVKESIAALARNKDKQPLMWKSRT